MLLIRIINIFFLIRDAIIFLNTVILLLLVLFFLLIQLRRILFKW